MSARASAPNFAPARTGPANNLGEAPPFPGGGAAPDRTQAGPRDLDPEDHAGMGHDEVTDPLQQRGPTRRNRMLRAQSLLQGAPLSIREADEHPVAASIGQRRAAAGGHDLADIMISGNRPRGLCAAFARAPGGYQDSDPLEIGAALALGGASFFWPLGAGGVGGRVQPGPPALGATGEDVRVMEQPIEERADGGGIAEEFAPVVDGTIRSQEC